jgi:hypothetical protein
MPDPSPCEKHEVSNCSYCTGAEEAFAASLEEPELDRGALPFIPGGVTIFAQYPGHCGRCGRGYPRGTAIHRRRDNDDGFVGVDCCAGKK